MASYTGTAGDDTLVGGDGMDGLNGGAGNDSLYGGANADILTGGPGNDYLSGQSGDDKALYGGYLSEYVMVWLGSQLLVLDSLPNRDGVDIVEADVEGLYVHAMAYAVGAIVSETTLGTPGDDSLAGGGGRDRVDGGDGADALGGGDGSDLLTGGGGNDTLDGGGGLDWLDGGAGSDHAVFSGNFADYVFGAHEGAGIRVSDKTGSRDGTDVVVNVETFHFLDQVVGYDTLYALATAATAPKVLTGTGASDTLTGENGNDTIQGGDGNDILRGAGGTDSVTGGNGTDTAVFSGSWAASEFHWFGSDIVIISGPDGGHDSIRGVEWFQFDDRTIAWDDLPMPIRTDLGASDHTVFGFGGNDTLNAGGGWDTIMGRGGDDLIDAGAGTNDRVVYRGNAAEYLVTHDRTTGGFIFADTLAGRDGTDTVTGAELFQFADGSAPASSFIPSYDLEGTGSADSLSGALRNDSLSGMEGNDTLQGHGGNDSLDGGAGDDTAVFTGMASEYLITYDLAAGAFTVVDTVPGRDGSDVITGVELLRFPDAAVGTDSLIPSYALEGSEEADSLAGAIKNDTLQGSGGNDTLEGRAGDDSLSGGSGLDTVVLRGNFADYLRAFDALTGTLTLADSVAGRDGTDTIEGVEHFVFADGTKTLLQLMGVVPTTGHDRFTGSGNPDLIDALAGNDSIDAAAGDDTLYGQAGNDSLLGGEGNDQLSGGSGNDYLNGGNGFDVADYAGESVNLRISLASTSKQATGAGSDQFVSIEGVRGGGGHDRLAGNAGANLLMGGAGNDTLDGGAAVDTLDGGLGNDTFMTDGADALLDEGGFDTVIFSGAGSHELPAGFEGGVLAGSAAALHGNAAGNHLTGNALANTIHGGLGEDTLFGGSGNDQLAGGEGSDTLDGQAGADAMEGGEGNDSYFVDHAFDRVLDTAGTDTVHSTLPYTLGPEIENLVLLGKASAGTGNMLDNGITGNAGANRLNGEEGHDRVAGMAGNDSLYGGSGNDTLDGGLGTDAMTGGAGEDVFIFATALRSNVDRIADFHAVEDTIALDNTIFAALDEGVLEAPAFQSGSTSAAAAASVRVVFNTATGAVLYDPDGSGPARAVQFATLAPAGLVGTITATDFIVL